MSLSQSGTISKSTTSDPTASLLRASKLLQERKTLSFDPETFFSCGPVMSPHTRHAAKTNESRSLVCGSGAVWRKVKRRLNGCGSDSSQRLLQILLELKSGVSNHRSWNIIIRLTEAALTEKEWHLHPILLAGWGTPIGELFNLEELAKMCEKSKRWSFFFTSAPLHYVGAVASPPNAMAMM